jgi:anti-anti-sigma factor
MPDPEFQHVRVRMVDNVTVVELVTENIQGPTQAQTLGDELALVMAPDGAKRLLLDFTRVGYFSSTCFAVLVKQVSQAKAAGREIKLCAMQPGVRLGAGIIGLDQIVEIQRDESAALRAFARV